MAIIGIGRNGVGLGHQSRVIALLDALYDRGERPVLLLQGQSCGVARTCYPTAPCPYIWQLTESQREDWRRTVEGYAQLSDPAVIIEDTHPIGISFSSSVRKVLLLRPVEFSAMMGLIQNNRAQFSDYVVADAPGSPTWPYAADETSSIMASNRVSIAGPIYRRPGAADVADVRHKYNLRPGYDICVFSMGGGGDHEGCDDATLFVARATVAAHALQANDPHARLIFVKGPLFSQKVRIPSIFETVAIEPSMPALFRVARAAMIRLGFNSVWEALGGGTPIYPFVGTSYLEPIDTRLRLLMERGLAFDNIVEAWHAKKANSRFAKVTRELSKQWSGCPTVQTLDLIAHCATTRIQSSVRGRRVPGYSSLRGALVTSPPDKQDLKASASASAWEYNDSKSSPVLLSAQNSYQAPSNQPAASSVPRLQAELREALTRAVSDDSYDRELSPLRLFHSKPEFVVRIDDVVDLHDGLKYFIDCVLSLHVYCALEMIPFHCKLTEQALSSAGLSTRTVEVGQHGYSHLPCAGFESPRAEFDLHQPVPTATELQILSAGKVMIQQRLGSFFSGGFSAPYDRLAPWLAEAWAQLGGRFLSFVWERPNGALVKTVRVPVDIWDWKSRRLHTIDTIVQQICASTTRYGYTGVVLHQQHLRDVDVRRVVKKLLAGILRLGYKSVRFSTRAHFQSATTTASLYREYNRHRGV